MTVNYKTGIILEALISHEVSMATLKGGEINALPLYVLVLMTDGLILITKCKRNLSAVQ